MQKEMKLTLRAPGYGLILNTLIFGVGLSFAIALPLYFSIPAGMNIGFLGWIVCCFIFILLFCVCVVIPIEFICLNAFWRKIVFECTTKKIAISNYLFFFPIGQARETEFSKASVSIDREWMMGSHAGAASGHVWVLKLKTPFGPYDLGNSVFKKFLKKKFDKISQYIKA